MASKHKVFISWSGSRSKHVAEALCEWLPMVVQAVGEPFMSEHIDKGARSMMEIAKALEGTKIGIVCLTSENLTAPWILYEAGALSKTVDEDTKLCTYLIGGLQKHNIQQPLGMFHATQADKDDTKKLVHTINQAVTDEPVPDTTINRLFELAWPTLEDKLNKLPTPKHVVNPKRSTDDMLAEILDTVRTLATRDANSFVESGRLAGLLKSLYEPNKVTGAKANYVWTTVPDWNKHVDTTEADWEKIKKLLTSNSPKPKSKKEDE